MEAYLNTPDNVWFHDAVYDRIVSCKSMACAYGHDGELTGYIGYDAYYVSEMGRVAYVEIATVFPNHQRKGIIQRLLRVLEDDYDGVMLRTQNPNMAQAMYQAYGSCEPLDCRPCDEAKKVASIIGSAAPYYDYEAMVCRSIYNGRCLTGQVLRGSAWFEKELYSRIDPESGDAIMLVSLFGKKTYQFRGF